MPITDYRFENRIFFAKESADITHADALDWSEQLKAAAEASPLPIVAVVDAMDVASVHRAAQQVFIDSAYFDNLLAVVVATNPAVALQAKTIGLLGKRGYTRVVGSLDKALQIAEAIVSAQQIAPH